LHRQASIQVLGVEVMQLGITTDPHERSAGIFGVVIPLGKRSSGRLQGIKVLPRPTPHPIFGKLTRLRVMIEEAENVPVGIWEDVTNILSNARGIEQFKLSAPFNPKDANGPCAQRCEPIDGWLSIDVEVSIQWVSKRGWNVNRLDAYKSQNVLKGTELVCRRKRAWKKWSGTPAASTPPDITRWCEAGFPRPVLTSRSFRST
jgi:hypothetical protein